MADVFEGAKDARQSGNVNHPVSRFRPTYRALRDEEKALHDAIKDKAEELEALITLTGKTDPLFKPERLATVARYRALSITALEESIMWAIKALTS